MGLLRDLFSVGTVCTKGLWETGKFVVKHTPEVLVVIVVIRREIIGGAQEIQDKIKLLSRKK